MSKFIVGEIAIADASPRRGQPARECEIIAILDDMSCVVDIFGYPDKYAMSGYWRISEKYLSKKPQSSENEQLTTWDHVQDSCGFTHKIKETTNEQ